MKTAAIICEFNPFHNGHAYLMKTLREKYDVDRIIAIMSGNYVQRGEPAIFDKHLRAESALIGDSDKGYADLVLEIPTLFSSASAREFARAGVITAVNTGIVDILAFGVEENVSLSDIIAQAELSDRLEADPKAQLKIKELIGQGLSYPEAVSRYIEAVMHKSKHRTLASQDVVGDESSACNAESLKFMQDSEAGGSESLMSEQDSEAASASAGSMYAANNILAVEYIKALSCFDTGHRIQPLAIQRVGDGFNAEEAKDEKYCSATAIRAELAKHSVYGSKLDTENASERDKEKSLSGSREVKTEGDKERPASIEAGRSELDGFLDNYAPNIRELILRNKARPVGPDILSDLLNKELLTAKYRGGELERCLDVSKEIADRLIKRADIPLSFTERIRDTKTRQYTYTRISRSLLHIVLGITDTEMETAKADGYIKYLRILGFRRDSSELMKELKNNARLPIVTKIADNKELMKDEIYYSGGYYALTGAKSEYERSPVIVD